MHSALGVKLVRSFRVDAGGFLLSRMNSPADPVVWALGVLRRAAT